MRGAHVETGVEVAGVPIDNYTLSEAVDAILSLIGGEGSHYVVTMNMDHAAMLRSDHLFREAYRHADLRVADGFPIVLLCRLAGTPLRDRVTGADLLPEVCKQAALEGRSVFLLGGRPEVNLAAADRLLKDYPELLIVGRASPDVGFEERPVENAALLDEIRKAQPDLLFVALGAPKQEVWMLRNLHSLPGLVAIGVGAAIDFQAGAKKRAPTPLQRLGLEWAFRLAQEWPRLWRRYLTQDLPFLPLLAFDALAARMRARRGAHLPVHSPVSAAFLSAQKPATRSQPYTGLVHRPSPEHLLAAMEEAGWEIERYVTAALPGRRVRRRDPDATASSPSRRLGPALVQRYLHQRAVLKTIGTDLDLAYEEYAPFEALGRPLQRRGVPWLVESPDLFELNAQSHHGPVERWLATSLYNRCDLVVCATPRERDTLVELYGIPATKIVVLPPSVDVGVISPYLTEPIRLFPGFTVGFVGHLTDDSRVEDLIDAISWCEQRSHDVSAVIVGNGPARPRLQALAEQLGIAARIRWQCEPVTAETIGLIGGFDVGFGGNSPPPVLDERPPGQFYSLVAMEVPVVIRSPTEAPTPPATWFGYVYDSSTLGTLPRLLSELSQDVPGVRARGQAARQRLIAEHSPEARVALLLRELEQRGIAVPELEDLPRPHGRMGTRRRAGQRTDPRGRGYDGGTTFGQVSS